MRMRVPSLTLLSGLRIQCCHKLWCRSQAQLGSLVAVAVAVAGSCGSSSTPSLGTSICHKCSHKKEKKKKKRETCFSLFSLIFVDNIILHTVVQAGNLETILNDIFFLTTPYQTLLIT